MTTTDDNGLADAVKQFDRSFFADRVKEAEAERAHVLAQFPLAQWPALALDQYALGLPESTDGFCNLIERKTPHVGSIRGGSSHNLLIFKYKQKAGWYYPDAYENEEDAWKSVRAGFVELFERVKAEQFEAADSISALAGAPALRVKASFMYAPERLLPICARNDLDHFLTLLGLTPVADHATLTANVRLRDHLEGTGHFDDWTPYEIERFLYAWSHPRKGPKVFKIAPGRAAEHWDECRKGGFICVGWDDVGDLAAYATKDEYRAAYAHAYPNPNEGHISRKANELWTLLELEPGDIVVANKGTATVVGIGRVIEPTYEYKPERPEYKHTVAIDWYDAKERPIPAVKKWAFDTVARIPQPLYKAIVGETGTPTITRTTDDPLFAQLEETLDRKRQVVLYGPPGTGKTYLARRFAVWWLSRHHGADTEALLGNPLVFREAEESLTLPATRKAWWFVASPENWKWQRMFDEGNVVYSRGKIEAHFDQLQVGDLVFGYEASPTRRIVALAFVSDWAEPEDGSKRTPILEPLREVANGPSWDDIKNDDLLGESEPVRHRSQGTIFAMSEDESDQLLALISENDTTAADSGEEQLQLPTGALTSVTFHPSYTYEDFVEGYKPVDTKESSGLRLELKDGVFARVCMTAEANPQIPHLLIIDEINRGNLPKIFGELLTVLERDKRGTKVTLAQSGDTFSVPDNVYVIGTMNTADRSVRLLDAALRRRFAFIEMLPQSDLLEGISVGPLALDEFLDELNNRIRVRYGREKQIGHSYFLDGGQPISEPETFTRVMRDEVMPLLQEYAYDHYGDLKELLGAGVVDAENETLQLDVIADSEAFVAALYEDFQATKS